MASLSFLLSNRSYCLFLARDFQWWFFYTQCQLTVGLCPPQQWGTPRSWRPGLRHTGERLQRQHHPFIIQRSVRWALGDSSWPACLVAWTVGEKLQGHVSGKSAAGWGVTRTLAFHWNICSWNSSFSPKKTQWFRKAASAKLADGIFPHLPFPFLLWKSHTVHNVFWTCALPTALISCCIQCILNIYTPSCPQASPATVPSKFHDVISWPTESNQCCSYIHGCQVIHRSTVYQGSRPQRKLNALPENFSCQSSSATGGKIFFLSLLLLPPIYPFSSVLQALGCGSSFSNIWCCFDYYFGSWDIDSLGRLPSRSFWGITLSENWCTSRRGKCYFSCGWPIFSCSWVMQLHPCFLLDLNVWQPGDKKPPTLLLFGFYSTHILICPSSFSTAVIENIMAKET